MLKSCEWESLSAFLHPNEIHRLLQISSKQSRLDFERVRTTVIKKLFNNIAIYVALKSQTQTTQEIFEWLTVCGYLPNAEVGYNNGNFGYLGFDLNCVENNIANSYDSKNTMWIEWKVANIQRMRQFWDDVLSRIKTQERANVIDNFKELVNFLPGEKVQCLECNWMIPMNSMQNKQKCIYCFDKNPKMERNKKDVRITKIEPIKRRSNTSIRKQNSGARIRECRPSEIQQRCQLEVDGRHCKRIRKTQDNDE